MPLLLCGSLLLVRVLMLIVILLTALLLRPSADLLCLASLHRGMMCSLLRENLLYLRFPEGIVQIILDSVNLTLSH